MFSQVTDVSNALKDRLKDRFWGALMISFAVFNWRALYILLFPSSEIDFFDRLEWIDIHLYNEWIQTLFRTLIGPVLLSSFSIAVVPWLTNVLESWRYKAFIVRQNNQLNLDQTRKDNEVEIQAVKAINRRVEGERDQLRVDLDNIKKELDQEREQNRRKAIHVEEEEKRYQQLIRQLLETAGVERRYISFRKRPERNAHDKNIHLLESAGVIQGDGHSWYKLTELGKHILELWPPKSSDQP